MAATKKALSEEQIAEIIALMSNGITLKMACKQAGVDYANIVTRITKSETLTKAHARAREEYQRIRVDEMREIAENEPDVQRARVMIDVIKWEAARVLHKEYGDKITAEHTGANGGAIEINHSKEITVNVLAALTQETLENLLLTSQENMPDEQINS
jgi:hypothetical protein